MKLNIPHGIYEEAPPKLPGPFTSLGLHWETGWRVFSSEPTGGRSRTAAASGNLGPGGAGRARPARAPSLVAAPTRHASAPPCAPRNPGSLAARPASRPARPGAAPLTLETLGGLRRKH